jgi:hypothetical protein
MGNGSLRLFLLVVRSVPVHFTGFLILSLSPSSRKAYRPIVQEETITRTRGGGLVMSDVKSSDAMANLVKFMIFLAVVALLATLVIYFTAVAPYQQAVAPMNLF